MVSTASPERSAKGEVLREKQKHQRVEVRMPHAAITGQADVCQGDTAGFIPHPAPLSDLFSWQQSKHISPIRLLSRGDYLDIEVLRVFLAITPDHTPRCHPAHRTRCQTSARSFW